MDKDGNLSKESDNKQKLNNENQNNQNNNIGVQNNEVQNNEAQTSGVLNRETKTNEVQPREAKTSEAQNVESRISENPNKENMTSREPQQREIKPRQQQQQQSQQRPMQSMMKRPTTSTSNGSFQQRTDNNRNEYRRSDSVKVDNSDNTTTENNEAAKIPANKVDSTKSDMATVPSEYEQLDSGETKRGILEVLSDGYGFIRCDNFLPGENDVYVSPAQIRRFNLKTGDIIVGNTRVKSQNEKFSALLYVKSINGLHPSEATKRKRFEDLTPIYPNERIHLETVGCGPAMRMVDLICPIGKGQRGMIVSQPKAGKTTLLKQVAKAITKNHSDMHLIVLLIDERPEEVTDMKESIEGGNVEVIYSTFDELPENHKRVSEMVIERAKRLVEHKKDVVILLDSITRLARAYNLTCQSSGRTLSGGLDPAALHMPKKFFGAARNMREGGSLTILATALVETGSRMDDVVFEEFKGTGNMELVLDRSLSEKRIFPAIDLPKSSTRRDDLLLTPVELEANYLMRKALNGLKSEDAIERIVQLFVTTKSNNEFVEMIKKTKL
jgi:transcription termination factor Rho